MKTQTQIQQEKLAVIYANEQNIWDNVTHRFCHGKNFDEASYSMSLKKADELLIEINKERISKGIEEAYLIELPTTEVV